MKVRSLLLAAALLTSAGVASAKEPTPDEVERARTFFNAGAQAYSAARYAEAARSFEEAEALAPRPQLLFSLAQAERKEFLSGGSAEYLKRSIAHYRQYLEQVPTGGRRSEATEAKADLDARLARLDPAAANATPSATEKRKARVTVYSATTGAQVSLDGGAPQELPYFGDLEPGKHRVRVFAEGYFDAEREVSGDRPIDQPLDLLLKEKPAIVTVVASQAGDFLVDGHVVAATPLSASIEVPAGGHVLSLAANGKRLYSQDVVLPRGKPYRFEPHPETSGQRAIAYGLLGIGAAAMVTSGGFGLLALGQEGKAKDINDERASGNISADRLQGYNRAIDRRDAFRNTALVTVSAGAAVAAGGVLLYLFDHPTVNVVPPRSVEPQPGPRAPGVDLSASPILAPGLWGGALTATF